MSRITPHLWFDTQARQATELYVTLLPDSGVTDITTIRDTPSGDCDIVSFTLAGQPFQAINAGPLFTFNPSISFRIDCATADEVDALWNTLIDGGQALMPLEAYPFSDRFGWLQDRFGLSWQIMRTDNEITQKVVPMLMFVGDQAGNAEEAIDLYTSVFPNSAIAGIDRHPAGAEPDVEGTVLQASFSLDGFQLAAMDSAHDHGFDFNEAVSLIVHCDDQDEIDHYWQLSAVPEAEQCGWLKDRFGVSWQIVPRAMDEMMQGADEATLARITQTFLQMKKFDIATLEAAYRETEAGRH